MNTIKYSSNLPTSFLEKLEEKLLSLPSWDQKIDREDKWMTSRQIAEWYSSIESAQFTESLVEKYLIDKWDKDDLKNIRPAKYPHSKTFLTLWGHTRRVYPLGKNKIQLRKTDPKRYYSQIKLSEDTPIIFISHSLKDFDFAVEISEIINKDFHKRTWLCEEALDINATINREIKDSICQCNALMVLVTFNSLGSAYVHSEIALGSEKLISVIKNDDADVVDVIKAYNEDPFTTDLDPLFKKFKQIEKRASRIKKYKTNANNILGVLRNKPSIVLFPNVPTKNTNKKFIDLSEAMEKVK